jgi:hypothetical protein
VDTKVSGGGYSPSIFRIEVNQAGKVEGYIQARGIKLAADDGSGQSDIWFNITGQILNLAHFYLEDEGSTLLRNADIPTCQTNAVTRQTAI